MGIRELVKHTHRYYGVDTETYNTPSFGLKSIQIATTDKTWYFTVDDWNQSDMDIRNRISKQFFDWINDLDHNATLGFFNINYDFSQIAHYVICDSGYKYVEHHERLSPGMIRILESDRQLYKVELVNPLGKRVVMIDIANFLTATNLNKACKDWIGKSKIDLPSKDFIKAPATDIEREYAIEDAKLTHELLVKLYQSSVIEKGTVTIAGRTLKHYKDYLKENFGLSFNKWAWGTDDSAFVEYHSFMAE